MAQRRRCHSCLYSDKFVSVHGVAYNYAYDASGALAKQYSTNSSDTVLEEYRYEYDSLGRLIRSSEYNNSAFTQRTEHIYDESDRLTSQAWYNGSGATSQTYTYSDTTGLLTGLEVDYPGNTPNVKIDYNYENLNRLSSKTTKVNGTPVFSTALWYMKRSGYNRASQVQHFNYKDSSGSAFFGFEYTYDDKGNIASEKSKVGDAIRSYTYDDQNQLTKAVYPDGTTYSYEYDTVGNIRKKIDGGTTHNYTYGDSKWADLLTKYDGHEIKYDDCGNPTKYYNGKTWNMEWSKGRELSRITRGSKTWDFTYDMAGVRSGKTVTTRDASTGEITGTTEYKYTTLSGKLVRVEYNTTVLDIVYDESGNPFSIRYKSNPTKEGVVYYYVLNVQGDVVGLLNSSGELVVEYKYDPWGKLLETKIGVDESNAKYDTYNNMALRNPLRYRRYIYDRDTGLYYLQSRYYDPAIGRFINTDIFATTNIIGLLSSNMFSYCENNPIMGWDPLGMSPAWWQWLVSGIAVTGGAILIATGVGGVAGGALICAGANSIIGSYTSEAAGGSSIAGWAGGFITGGICGVGAGIAGNLYINATNLANFACLGELGKSIVYSFGLGTFGSLMGQGISAALDSKQMNFRSLLVSAMTTGAINCLSGIGSAIGAAIREVPMTSTTSAGLANALDAATTAITELVCDFIGMASYFLL